jgi:hypothetical protein
MPSWQGVEAFTLVVVLQAVSAGAESEEQLGSGYQ